VDISFQLKAVGYNARDCRLALSAMKVNIWWITVIKIHIINTEVLNLLATTKAKQIACLRLPQCFKWSLANNLAYMAYPFAVIYSGDIVKQRKKSSRHVILYTYMGWQRYLR